ERQEAAEPPPEETPLTPEESAAWEAWKAQQKVLTKLRVLADEARTYEQDTGAYVLNLGFPLLRLPASGGKRVLAPVAFVPVSLAVKPGATAAVEITCRGDKV